MTCIESVPRLKPAVLPAQLHSLDLQSSVGERLRRFLLALLVLLPALTAAAQPATRRTLQRISAEAQRTCVVRADGSVACSGLSASGNLGTGLSPFPYTTMTVVSGVSNAVAVASGNGHTCALRANGTVLCWGSNSFGQLGDGTTTLRTSPVQVQNLTDFVDLRAAENTTCGIRAIGEVWCWGDNGDGQLGNSSTSSSSVPVAVWNVTDAVALSVGSSHACAVASRGVAVCWGSNASGKLGDGTSTDRTVPVLVDRLVDAVDIAVAGGHTCAIRATGQVACWGDGLYGRLGLGTTVSHRTPQTVTQLTTPAVRIDAGLIHTCALLATGDVACWGRDSEGQLGDGPNDGTGFTPGLVLGLTDALDVTAGTNHSCALRGNGRMVCWGSNINGQLANGSTDRADSPEAVSNLSASAPVRMAAGARHSCTVDGDGTARCWGDNDAGQLGDGALTNRTRPYSVAGLSDVRSIAAGTRHTCAVTVQGAVRCWGRNADGQVGLDNIADQRVPVAVAGLSNVRAVAAGDAHSCALLASGGVRCWGLGSSGQLGDGNASSSKAPVAVSGLSDAVAIAAGDAYSCALRVIGEVWCWGANASGQLGNNGTSASLTPTNVWDVTDAVSIAAGSRHACAQRDDGRTACWGTAYTGDGTGQTALRPVAVSRVTNAVAVTARGTHTCLRRATGELACWGDNATGQIGNGGTARSFLPEEVVEGGTGSLSLGGADEERSLSAMPALLGNATDVAAGAAQTCAATGGGGLYCWGAAGLLGNGSSTQSTTPLAVSSGALPVELLTFTAVADGPDRVRLAWTTASETNNAGFVVERRAGASWVNATPPIAGRGTTSERAHYTALVDGLPPYRHAFRLRQIDLDGTSTLSAAVEVVLGGAAPVSLTNLGGGRVRVTASGAGVRVSAYDVLGRLVLAHVVVEGKTDDLDLAGLASGVYVVRATSAAHAQSLSIVVR